MSFIFLFYLFVAVVCSSIAVFADIICFVRALWAASLHKKCYINKVHYYYDTLLNRRKRYCYCTYTANLITRWKKKLLLCSLWSIFFFFFFYLREYEKNDATQTVRDFPAVLCVLCSVIWSLIKGERRAILPWDAAESTSTICVCPSVGPHAICLNVLV